MGKVHYHVLSGMHGYMPDSNYVYTNKATAIADMVQQKRDVIDEWYSIPSGCGLERPCFTGSAREGYYEIDNMPGLHYMEILECEDPECLQGGE